MRKEQITCDVCGKDKQATNHWFVAVIFNPKDQAARVMSVMGAFALTTYGGMMQVEARFKDSAILDLCGESCVLKKVSELIGGKSAS